MEKDEYIDFEVIRNLLDMKDPYSFKFYLKEAYKDLSDRKESSKKLGVSKLNFTEYINCHVFIASKFFIALDKNEDEYLNFDEFSYGIFTLFFGSFENVVKLIFDIYDFNKDGFIEKEDVKILLSYIPIEIQSDHKMQMNAQIKSAEEIEGIIDKTFELSEKLNLDEYSIIVEKTISDSFIQLLCLIYVQTSFTKDNIDIYRTYGSKVQNKAEQSPPRSSSPKRRLPSPKKDSLLSPSRKLIEKYGEDRDEPEEDIEEIYKKQNIVIPLKKDKLAISKKGEVNLDEAVLRMDNKKTGDSGLMDSPTNFLKKKTVIEKDFVIQMKRLDLDDESNEEEKAPKEEKMIRAKRAKTEKRLPTKGLTNKENWIYKVTDNMKIKKFWLVLIGKEIFYYKSDDKTELKGMHILTGCFVKDLGEKTFGENKMYCFTIIFSSKTRKYYSQTIQEHENWISTIKEAIGFTSIFDNYEIKNDLGEGKFGMVKLAIHKNTGEKVAIKVISKENMNERDLELVKSELDIMKICKHPNIVMLLDHYENANTIYIIMEYLCGGSFDSYLQKHDPISITEEIAAKITYQIAMGLKYIHKYGIMHRDLKPDNIMLSEKINNFMSASETAIKIMDFGLSKILGPKEKALDGFGTLSFVAPEVLTRQPYGRQIDVWSLGIILYYTVSGILPFDDESDSEEVIAKKIVFSELKFPSKYFQGFSAEMLDLLKCLLHKNPDKRIEIKDVLTHDFIRKNLK